MTLVGKNKNVLKLTLRTAQGNRVQAVYFGNTEAFVEYYSGKYGASEVERAFSGRQNAVRMSLIYYPEINSYQGNETVQLIIKNYQ